MISHSLAPLKTDCRLSFYSLCSALTVSSLARSISSRSRSANNVAKSIDSSRATKKSVIGWNINKAWLPTKLRGLLAPRNVIAGVTNPHRAMRWAIRSTSGSLDVSTCFANSTDPF